jgi:hypothetical protein
MLIMNGKDITPKHSKTLSVKVDEFKNKSKTRFGFVVIRDTHGVWNAVRRGEVEAKGADLEHIDTYLSLSIPTGADSWTSLTRFRRRSMLPRAEGSERG